MKINEQLLREMEDLRERLKETDETLHYLQSREEMLRKSEQEKTTILESLSEEITHLDMDMRVLWTNRTANESAGLTSEQIIGCHCYDVWCRNGEPRIDCPAVRTIRTGQREQGEVSIPNGRTLLHRSYPTHDAKGKMSGIVIITLDLSQRKQAEKALLESEHAYRTFTENLPGMVYRVFIRENNRMEFFNKMLKPMTGYTAEELTAGEVCSIEPFILNEDREAVVTIVRHAILNHLPFEVEYRLRNKGGEIRYFLERGKPLYGEDGGPLYIDGVILDITARKVAEEALRKSDQEKAVILNATWEAMGIVDRSLRVVWANKVCGDRAGLPMDQLPGHYCYEIWAARSEPCVGCPVLKTIETGRSEEVEISSSDGKIWLHRGYPVQNISGQIESVVAIAIDITEHKQNEEKLRKHAQILDQIHDSVISTDLKGYVVTWNKGAERIFGYPAEEGLGKHISFVYPPDQHGFLQNEVIEPLKKKGRHEIEVKMRRKSGEDFYAHLSLSMLKNNEGLDIGMIGSSVDLTERREMEEALKRSRDELEMRVQGRTAELVKANELLEKLFSNINTMIAYTDKNFKFLRVNRAWAEDDGRGPEFFVGKNLFDLFPSVDKKDFMKVLETGEPTSGYGKPFVHPEHPERGVTYWDWSVQPVKEPDGKVAGVVLSFVNVTERKRAEETLRESEKRLRFLSSQLITLQEQERKRIATELHDSLAALLNGIKYKVEVALQQRAKNKLKAAEKQLESVIPMIQESVEEVRRIQTGLRPITLDSLGLLATIRSFCRKFQTTHPSISIQQQIDIEEGEVPASLKIVIYRISQEALNNIGKHSRADFVHLSLRKREGKIELLIQDNGRGFDVNESLSMESSERGLGLISMRERAELSGGSFAIQSNVGKGTSIRASWSCI
jgi:PAS domain S-box-containing protein